MVRRNSGVILRQLHALLDVGTFGGLSDRQLLDRFLARYDEASELAFTVLVERHGPMVLGVCRRILVDPHDAEDAFQATFLVLVRKAGSVRVDGSIGRWLFGVATRVATRARADARRRRGRERPGAERLDVGTVEEATAATERIDLQSILTEEIARLPARLQVPVIVCDLEGCSYDQAAHRLGWPVGTVKSRLSRARGLLRQRLTRRGLAPDDLATSIPMIATSLTRALVETTIKSTHSPIAGRLTTLGVVSTSVATLTEGVLKTMYWTKIKPAIVATLLIVGGSAFVYSQAPAPKPNADRPLPEAIATREQATPSDAAIDIEMLERAWAAAIPRRDVATVNRIIADDYEGIDPTFTKATYLSDLRGKGAAALSIELDEIKTRVFGDTAVAITRFKVSTDPHLGWTTHLYVRRQGRWQCVAAHASWTGKASTPIDKAAELGEFHYETTDTTGTLSNQSKPQGQPGALGPMMQGMMGGRSQAQGQQRMAAMMGGQSQVQGQPGMAPMMGSQSQNQGQMGGMRAMIGGSNNQLQSQGQTGMRSMMGGMGGRMRQSRPNGQSAATLQLPAGQVPIQVRLQFAFRVEKIFVETGNYVRKGDPLLEVFSTELAEAKSNYEMAYVQWTHDRKVYDYKLPLAKENSLAKKELIEVESNETQSRLKVKLAKDKLLIYGLLPADISEIPSEDGERRARFTFHSRADGQVTTLDALVGVSYNGADVLMLIKPGSLVPGSMDSRFAPTQ